jgi:hypothetical protein
MENFKVGDKLVRGGSRSKRTNTVWKVYEVTSDYISLKKYHTPVYNDRKITVDKANYKHWEKVK